MGKSHKLFWWHQVIWAKCSRMVDSSGHPDPLIVDRGYYLLISVNLIYNTS